jgi:hypothetical protein
MMTSLPLKLALSLALLTGAVVLPGCTSTDPEFASGGAGAGANAKGDEVVGRWYAYSENKGVVTGKFNTVLDLRGNGTGQIMTTGQGSAFMNGKIQFDKAPRKVTWNYKGGGVWAFTQESPEMGVAMNGTMTLSGGRLYRSTKVIVPTAPIVGWGLMQNKEVFVRADDAAAISDEHLRNNRSH